MRPLHSLLPLVVSAWIVLVMTMGGCSSTSRTVSGLVYPGRASVVTLVSSNDPRLKGPGVGDVHLRLTHGGGTPASLTETTSNHDGSFSLRVSDQWLRGRLELTATRSGMLPCRGSIYLPTDDRRILVIVELNDMEIKNDSSVSTEEPAR